MPAYRVTCIIKQEPYSPVERIQELQWTDDNGGGWWGTPQFVANKIKSGLDQFFVRNGWARTYLHWREGRNGDFVQTYANDVWTDNLLELPQCVWSYRPT